MAQAQSFRDAQIASSEIGVRTIGLNDLWQSLKEGYDDFNAMGFVGAGGLGQLMDQSMKMMNGAEAATILVVFLLLVLMADAVSAALRKGLA